MSLSALLLIADDRSVRDACRGWMPPLEKLRTKRATNPFTGSEYEVQTLVPEELERSLREPTVDEVAAGLSNEVFERLSQSKPAAVQFTVSNDVYAIYKDAAPFLYGDVHGEVHEIRRVEPDQEAAALQHFTHLAGPWMGEQYRRAKGLSLFIYIYA